MALFIGFLLLGLLVVVALKLFNKAQAPTTTHEVERRPLLTENEREFFARLVTALPDYYIFPQVAANALLQVSESVPKQRFHATRNRFAQKHVDFVVCDRASLDVRAIIELDDRTHRAGKDQARDAMFANAGYITHRFASRQKPTIEAIAALFENSPVQDGDVF
jgi:very-short-patch-repair endonuclease